uniref:Transcriptional regulator SrnQ n=1 Tax=Streptomyces griseus TaxID=1911 RepID=Q8L1Y2_STRGR|nr:transcriptional regulator SrnQ [Streptomyces griseus]
MIRPRLASVIERRLLVNYRVDPHVAAALLPAPLRPQLVARPGGGRDLSAPYRRRPSRLGPRRGRADQRERGAPDRGGVGRARRRRAWRLHPASRHRLPAQRLRGRPDLPG